MRITDCIADRFNKYKKSTVLLRFNIYIKSVFDTTRRRDLICKIVQIFRLLCSINSKLINEYFAVKGNYVYFAVRSAWTGVHLPKGNILGHYLFLFFIKKDIPKIKNLKIVLYDDNLWLSD